MSMEMLIQKIQQTNNPSVVGLDPKLEFIPTTIRNQAYAIWGKTLKGAAEAIWEFNKSLIDILCQVVPAVKPQSAYYEMYGPEGVRVLRQTIAYAKLKGMYVIADVKRNDIGTTAEAYAQAYLGLTVIEDEIAEEAFGADSVTVNPMLGTDGIEPFIKQCNARKKSIFVLVKTSNPSSCELQDILSDEKPVYEKNAKMVCEWGKASIGNASFNNVGAVVGATWPEQATVLRKLMPHTFFLVPGYGAQGGSADDVKPCFCSDGTGAIVNSSRAILCAWKNHGLPESEFANAALNEALRMKDELNSVRFK